VKFELAGTAGDTKPWATHQQVTCGCILDQPRRPKMEITDRFQQVENFATAVVKRQGIRKAVTRYMSSVSFILVSLLLHSQPAHLVKDINPLIGGNSQPANFIQVGGIVFFTATDGNSGDGTELWRTDGTADGTRLIRDINLGSQGSSPSCL
jgi:ELWxxDGT repeat protein